MSAKVDGNRKLSICAATLALSRWHKSPTKALSKAAQTAAKARAAVASAVASSPAPRPARAPEKPSATYEGPEKITAAQAEKIVREAIREATETTSRIKATGKGPIALFTADHRASWAGYFHGSDAWPDYVGSESDVAKALGKTPAELEECAWKKAQELTRDRFVRLSDRAKYPGDLPVSAEAIEILAEIAEAVASEWYRDNITGSQAREIAREGVFEPDEEQADDLRERIADAWDKLPEGTIEAAGFTRRDVRDAYIKRAARRVVEVAQEAEGKRSAPLSDKAEGAIKSVAALIVNDNENRSRGWRARLVRNTAKLRALAAEHGTANTLNALQEIEGDLQAAGVLSSIPWAQVIESTAWESRLPREDEEKPEPEPKPEAPTQAQAKKPEEPDHSRPTGQPKDRYSFPVQSFADTDAGMRALGLAERVWDRAKELGLRPYVSLLGTRPSDKKPATIVGGKREDAPGPFVVLGVERADGSRIISGTAWRERNPYVHLFAVRSRGDEIESIAEPYQLKTYKAEVNGDVERESASDPKKARAAMNSALDYLEGAAVGLEGLERMARASIVDALAMLGPDAFEAPTSGPIVARFDSVTWRLKVNGRLWGVLVEWAVSRPGASEVSGSLGFGARAVVAASTGNPEPFSRLLGLVEQSREGSGVVGRAVHSKRSVLEFRETPVPGYALNVPFENVIRGALDSMHGAEIPMPADCPIVLEERDKATLRELAKFTSPPKELREWLQRFGVIQTRYYLILVATDGRRLALEARYSPAVNGQAMAAIPVSMLRSIKEGERIGTRHTATKEHPFPPFAELFKDFEPPRGETAAGNVERGGWWAYVPAEFPALYKANAQEAAAVASAGISIEGDEALDRESVALEFHKRDEWTLTAYIKALGWSFVTDGALGPESKGGKVTPVGFNARYIAEAIDFVSLRTRKTKRAPAIHAGARLWGTGRLDPAVCSCETVPGERARAALIMPMRV